jgi:hypothetical protein
MKYKKQHLDVPVDVRHFDFTDYRRNGISEIVNLDDYVETIVKLVDARNEETEVDGWRDERLFRELLDFSDYLLKILKNVSYKDAEAFLRKEQRIKQLELSLGLRKKPSPLKKKDPAKDDNAEIEKIAKLMK